MKRRFTVESSRTMIASSYVRAWSDDVPTMLWKVQKKYGEDSSQAQGFQRMIDDDLDINRIEKRYQQLMK